MLRFTKSIITNYLPRQRYVHINTVARASEKSPLFILRQKTGLAYSLCREALNKHEDNVAEAEAWLKAHALAHGLQKASKVRDRRTREGLVCLAVPKDNSLTTIVELNCETDFVAKNQLFKDFALDITQQISSCYKDSTSQKLPDQTVVVGSKPNETLINDIENQIVSLITKLGENIKLARALHIHPTNGSQFIKLYGQIHAMTAKKVTDQYDVMAGRFGAIVALDLAEEAQSKSQDSLRLLGNRLCQHVIGYNPSYIILPANIRRHLEEVEKEKRNDKSLEGADATNGSLSDNEGSESPSNSRDEWPSMMDQTLIMTDDVLVQDFCKDNGISIVYFNRLECGMESW